MIEHAKIGERGAVLVRRAPGLRALVKNRRRHTRDRRKADPDLYRRMRLRGGCPTDRRAWFGPDAGDRRGKGRA